MCSKLNFDREYFAQGPSYNFTWKVTDFPLPVESPSAKIAACLISLGLFINAAAEFSVAILAKL